MAHNTPHMLIETIGGSTAYGLNTPTSDLDKRGVFINTDVETIVGLGRFDHVCKQETEDTVLFEVRKFFSLLREGNTGAMEILFTDRVEHVQSVDKRFEELVLKERYRFVDTDKMFRCLLGYMQGERRLANGERSGRLGGKRRDQVDTYGFSPKNFVQLLRLAECGIALFRDGKFPVNMREHNVVLADYLLDVKVHPEKHTKIGLNRMADVAEENLKKAYDERNFEYAFDNDYANEVLRQLYLPYLVK